MKIPFSRGAMLFYAGTLGTVALLFQQVTQYGETHLQAPPNLNGRYISAENFPGCSAVTLALDVQQSGIYLSGSLRWLDTQTVAETASAVDEEKPSLHGLWQSEQLMLSGATPAFVNCQISADATMPVKVEGIRSEPTGLTGKITFGDGEPIAFTAQREAVLVPTSSKH